MRRRIGGWGDGIVSGQGDCGWPGCLSFCSTVYAPRAMEPCLVFCGPRPTRLRLAATNRQISTTSSPHRHVPPTSPPPSPPLDDPDIFSTLLDPTLFSHSLVLILLPHASHPNTLHHQQPRRLHDISCPVPLIPNLRPVSRLGPFHTSRPNSGLSRTRSLDVLPGLPSQPLRIGSFLLTVSLSHFWKPAQEHFLFRPVLRG